jgi:alpha-beta hydrolase superfamily lysophospholipase
MVVDKFADDFSPFNKAVEEHIKPMSIRATAAAVITIAFSVGAAILAAVH